MALRVDPRTLLTADDLAAVRRASDWKGVAVVAHAWGVIGLAMAMAAQWPLTLPLAVAIIGSRQLGLAILMHDGAHGILARTRWLNDLLSQAFCAWPIFTETFSYRLYHLRHHARTQQAEDPDLPLSAAFPISPASFRRKMLRDLSGQTAFQQRRAQIRGALGDRALPAAQRARHFARKLGPQIAVNAALFALLAALGVWWLYPVLWLLPLMTWFMAVTRIRNIAEHAMVPDDTDPFRNARTTRANLVERAFLAPYWVNYHVEHHLMMWVPCYNLPRLHRMLVRNGVAERMEIQPGYRSVLRLALSGTGGGAPRRRMENRVFEAPASTT